MLALLTELTESYYTCGYGLLWGRLQVKISHRKRHIEQSWKLCASTQSFPDGVRSQHWCVILDLEYCPPEKLAWTSVSEFLLEAHQMVMIDYAHGWSQPPGWLIIDDSKPLTLNHVISLSGVTNPAIWCKMASSWP